MTASESDKDAESVAANMIEAVRYLADVAAEAGLTSVSIELRCVCGSLMSIIRESQPQCENDRFDTRN